MRWVATLIARPEVRMMYGVLLMSEKQGLGKNTLADTVLAPLVGRHNVAWPTENDITESSFNGWLANKRLVVIGEIYAGHSWKAYNRLKTAITDKFISVNEKYQRPYTVENWAHFVACSNAEVAMKMADEDRRWLVPQLNEAGLWPLERFIEFRHWLKTGGLEIIKHWAETFGDYVQEGGTAPMSSRKQELVDESRSEPIKLAVAIAEALADEEKPAALIGSDIRRALEGRHFGKVFEGDPAIRKAMVGAGARALGRQHRVKIAKKLEHIICNTALVELIGEKTGEELGDLVRSHKTSVSDICPM
jgi:hypothetical protein